MRHLLILVFFIAITSCGIKEALDKAGDIKEDISSSFVHDKVKDEQHT